MIIGALIVFDYVLSGYQNLVHIIFAGPYVGQTHWDQPTRVEYTYFYWISIFLLELIGYSLFGWLALQYARGDNLENAYRSKLFGCLFLAFVCFAGLDLVATQLTPWLFIWRDWFADPGARFYFFGTIAAGLILYVTSAYFLSRRYSGNAFSVVNSAFFGFLAATQIIQWAHAPSSFVHSDMPWMRTAIHYVSDFTYTALWAIAFIAFVVVLAAPAEDKAPPK